MCDMEKRFGLLRVALRLTWGGLAQYLDLSRSMMDQVRKGQRNLSFPALARLEEAERSAGLSPPVALRLETPARSSGVSENGSISEGAEEIREIAAALRELLQRVERLEKRLNK